MCLLSIYLVECTCIVTDWSRRLGVYGAVDSCAVVCLLSVFGLCDACEFPW